MDEAYYLADRIDVINHGKIIAEGSPEDLINSMAAATRSSSGSASSELELLQNEMPGSKREGHDITIRLPEGDGMASISKAITLINDRHVACKELYVKKSTLEDVFLNLTGEKLVQEVA